MPVVWLKEDVDGAAWASHASISAATRYLAEKGIKLHATQVRREAKCSGSRNGWRFLFAPNRAAKLVAKPAAKPCAPQSLTSLLGATGKVCGRCDAQFGGHVKRCFDYGKNNHELCSTRV